MTFAEFSLLELVLIALIFVWSGFVRSGLGFGGAALGLPFFLLVENNVLLWMPMIGLHMMFFSMLTLSKNYRNVDWVAFKNLLLWLIIPILCGVFGLISLPLQIVGIIVYSFTLFYGVVWMMQLNLSSQSRLLDVFFLILGGYMAGNSLTGAPLIVIVAIKQIKLSKYRDTLFSLWFVLVAIKLTTLHAVDIDLQFTAALMALPFAAIGHVIGLKLHVLLVAENDKIKPIIGAGLGLISLIGLVKLIF